MKSLGTGTHIWASISVTVCRKLGPWRFTRTIGKLDFGKNLGLRFMPEGSVHQMTKSHRSSVSNRPFTIEILKSCPGINLARVLWSFESDRTLSNFPCSLSLFFILYFSTHTYPQESLITCKKSTTISSWWRYSEPHSRISTRWRSISQRRSHWSKPGITNKLHLYSGLYLAWRFRNRREPGAYWLGLLYSSWSSVRE